MEIVWRVFGGCLEGLAGALAGALAARLAVGATKTFLSPWAVGGTAAAAFAAGRPLALAAAAFAAGRFSFGSAIGFLASMSLSIDANPLQPAYACQSPLAT